MTDEKLSANSTVLLEESTLFKRSTLQRRSTVFQALILFRGLRYVKESKVLSEPL